MSIRFAGLWRRAERQPIVVLGRHKLYILPTRIGLLFAIAAVTLLLASVNYQIGLGYALTFLLVSSGIVSMLYTHRNLSGVRAFAAPPVAVFAGEQARFDICFANDTRLARYALDIEYGAHKKRINLAPRESTKVAIHTLADKRGYLDCPSFVVASSFPLSLLRSWSRTILLEQQCVVYPRPAERRAILPLQRVGNSGLGLGPGSDDFIGLRPFQPGDSPQRISWKALARGLGPQIKQFGGESGQRLWIDWQAFAPAATEERLSLMCRAVLDAEAAGFEYGMRLPRLAIAPASGSEHLHQCLAALALFAG